ncbi:iron-containing alcohol dehydrogenase [Desulfomicrobium sp. ZS1]|uniref:iron-containing alcohol dehydrogenase n=1 Tax=Desulfomicrobium sp. ZS1 TaxID=2952228 RepID=UPI0020B3CEA5|nr:iron-containing alcohol dehydrogenase [Desulfomicrobium sp. ZS1]UTF51375.1 iron-containing alcohol dehydrogenase [Desulfomicrobium sp. ZS1]
MIYSFSTARVVFGIGARAGVATHAAHLGKHCLLVTGSRAARCDWLLENLREVMDEVTSVAISGEPDTAFISAQAEAARGAGCDVVVAIGGGSVIDAGKALAALVANTGDLFDYLEVVGRGLPLEHNPLPMIAVPTTAGTGAEVTANAVLLSPAHGVKASLRAPGLIPSLAVVDPELAVSLPPRQTAASGMDALTQLMETFVSHAASPLTDPLCRDGLTRAARSLRIAVQDGADLRARSDMALAALFSGMALANAKLGAVHGFAAPLGAMLGAAHGEICAALLPHVMEANIKVLLATDSSHPALDRYAEVGHLLTGVREAQAGVDFVRSLCADLGVRGLKVLGLDEGRVDEAARKAAKASSMKGNPVVLDHERLVSILLGALGE